MANVDAPFGLRPIRMRGGAPYNGAVNKYEIKSDLNAALYIGDPVIKTGTSNSRGMPYVQIATLTASNAVTGVIVGWEGPPNTANLEQQYSVALNKSIALVCDDPDVVFLIKDDASAVPAVTDVGTNAYMSNTDGGSTTTGLSGVELNLTTPATTSTYQLKILRLYDVEGNDIAINAIWEVIINNHTEAHGTDGI